MTAHDLNTTVRDFAAAIPGATRLFERVGIDYCCGGGKPLADACSEKGIEADELLRSLADLEVGSRHVVNNPSRWTLATLVDHIVDTHHVFTRDELARLEMLFEKVIAAHGERHPELSMMREVFCRLADDLRPHMLKEEQVLFPFIKRLEVSAEMNVRVPPPPFGTVRNPIRMMEVEHDVAGELLAQLRSLGLDYVPPDDACMSFRTLYEALDGLERDLHQHIHLENNVLFPRAAALEHI